MLCLVELTDEDTFDVFVSLATLTTAPGGDSRSLIEFPLFSSGISENISHTTSEKGLSDGNPEQ